MKIKRKYLCVEADIYPQEFSLPQDGYPAQQGMYIVNIFDLTGKPVNSFQTKSGSRLNLLLPAGVYIVSLTGSKGTLTKKLIVH